MSLVSGEIGELFHIYKADFKMRKSMVPIGCSLAKLSLERLCLLEKTGFLFLQGKHNTGFFIIAT